jgi:hypothetical protein
MDKLCRRPRCVLLTSPSFPVPLRHQPRTSQATGFTAPDKQEPLRRDAKALFKALVAKLDALSSFHYAPKPVVEELEVRRRPRCDCAFG